MLFYILVLFVYPVLFSLSFIVLPSYFSISNISNISIICAVRLFSFVLPILPILCISPSAITSLAASVQVQWLPHLLRLFSPAIIKRCFYCTTVL